MTMRCQDRSDIALQEYRCSVELGVQIERNVARKLLPFNVSLCIIHLSILSFDDFNTSAKKRRAMARERSLLKDPGVDEVLKHELVKQFNPLISGKVSNPSQLFIQIKRSIAFSNLRHKVPIMLRVSLRYSSKNQTLECLRASCRECATIPQWNECFKAHAYIAKLSAT